MKIYLIKIEAEIPDEKDLYDIIEDIFTMPMFGVLTFK